MDKIKQPVKSFEPQLGTEGLQLQPGSARQNQFQLDDPLSSSALLSSARSIDNNPGPSQSNGMLSDSDRYRSANENIGSNAKGGSHGSNSEMKSEDKWQYWKKPEDGGTRGEDVVIIHVCDENQRISRDFCCKRDILVGHMKYFEKFLAENENGYDDIDISVHCDVEIFEWLMTYIHEPDKPPRIDKAIIVSILISSEFLQMESLVELCVQHVSSNMNEIIKLPIDLSCISEKLINRIAFLTHPKVSPCIHEMRRE